MVRKPDELEPLAGLLEVLAAWQATPQASGAYWALAGYDYQFSEFLRRFFANAVRDPGQGADDPGDLFLEFFSDITVATANELHVVQVKHATLGLPELRRALREFCEILRVCQAVQPALAERLVFQIVCPKALDSARQPRKATARQLKFRTSQDTLLLEQVKAQLHATEPVRECGDPYDGAYRHLRLLGLLDPAPLLQEAKGLLLENVGRGKLASRDIGRRLHTLFFEQDREPPLPDNADLLKPDSFKAHSSPDSQRVLTGQIPQRQHLQHGCFMPRPTVFEHARCELHRWRADSFPTERSSYVDQLPVFWLAGRSGEGKSVLLLQLVQALVEDPQLRVIAAPVESLLEVLAHLGVREAVTPVILYVDDIYHSAGEDWKRKLGKALARIDAPVGIVTCGPPEYLKQFRRHSCQLTAVPIGKFNPQELPGLLDWYEQRRKEQVSAEMRQKLQLAQNLLLVQVLFELSQGPLRDFAIRFRERLGPGFASIVQQVLALNALDLYAPRELVPPDEGLERQLHQLCAADQLHFEVSADGVRLAHPFLAWHIFREWCPDNQTLSQFFGTQLGLTLQGSGLSALLRKVLDRVFAFERGRWAEDAELYEENETVGVKQVLRNLFRQSSSTNPALVRQELAAWLECELRTGGLGLEPDPVALAWELLDAGADALQSRAVVHLWCIQDWREEPAAQRRLLDWLIAHPQPAYSGRAVVRIQQTKKKRRQRWEKCAAPVLPLDPGDAKRELLHRWLELHRATQYAGPVLSHAAAHNLGPADLQEWTDRWLAAHSDHPDADNLLAAIIPLRQDDAQLYATVCGRLAKQTAGPSPKNLIEAAVATWHDRAAVIELARAWLAQNQAAPAYPSMVALLTAITGLAEFYTLSEKLYAAAADDDRRSEFLRALLPRSYGHRKYVTAAVELITKDPQRRRGLQQYLGRAMIFGESVLGTGRSVLGALLRSEPAPTREILEESVFRAIRFDDVAHSVFIRRDIPLLPEPYPCKILGRLVQWKTYAGLDAQTRAAVFAATVTVLRSFPAGFVHLRQQLNWNQPLLAELLNVETIPSTVKRALQIAQASRR